MDVMPHQISKRPRPAGFTERFGRAVRTASRATDTVAGLALGAVALLVGANILLRTLWNRPIVGTYEMVGYITAAVIGLSLANCAVQQSHIAVDFLTRRIPPPWRRRLDIVMHLPVALFLGLVTFHVASYALRIAASGEVAPTTQIPFYPFILLVAFGFLLLTLTVLLHLAQLYSGEETL